MEEDGRELEDGRGENREEDGKGWKRSKWMKDDEI